MKFFGLLVVLLFLITPVLGGVWLHGFSQGLVLETDGCEIVETSFFTARCASEGYQYGSGFVGFFLRGITIFVSLIALWYFSSLCLIILRRIADEA